MKACAETVQSSVGEELTLDTLTSVSQNEEKDVQEYLDSIQSYLKNKMDQVSVPCPTGEMKDEPVSNSQVTKLKPRSKKKVAAKLANVKVSNKKLIPRVELERLPIESDKRVKIKDVLNGKAKRSINIKAGSVQSTGKAKSIVVKKTDLKKTKAPKTNAMKPLEKPAKKLSKCLPHIILKLPSIKKTSPQPKNKTKVTKGKSVVVSANKCKKAKIAKAPIKGKTTRQRKPKIVSDPKHPRSKLNKTKTLTIPPNTNFRTVNPIIANGFHPVRPPTVTREFDSLRALASSYVSNDNHYNSTSFTVICPVKTEPELDGEDPSVVPMSLISHRDAMQQGPFTETLKVAEPGCVDLKMEIETNTCIIHNQPNQ